MYIRLFGVQKAEEYQKLLGYRSHSIPTANVTRRRRYTTYYSNTVDISTLPACIDWTQNGWVGPVMNQVIIFFGVFVSIHCAFASRAGL